MAYLILDLDLTCFVKRKDLSSVNQSKHSLSINRTIIGKNAATLEDAEATVQIINPKELAALIEFAYQHTDGVIFLTSGCWDKESVLAMLSTELAPYLSAETAKKLKSALFHSAFTDLLYFWKPGSKTNALIHDIALRDKNERLKAILKHNPRLAKKWFAFMDDSLSHINSFVDMPNVFSILATTFSEDKSFYETAKEFLLEAQRIEMEMHQKLTFETHRVANSPQFFQAVPLASPKPKQSVHIDKQPMTSVKSTISSSDKENQVDEHPGVRISFSNSENWS